MNKKLFWLLFAIISLGAAFLRLYHLTQAPPSLYWEEAALGYDAYSILQTGHDHHGHPFPIVAFESFGDWKPALYFYAIIPFIKLVGLNAWAVRLPAALSGISIVLGVGVLARLFTKKAAVRDRNQLIAMTITAISPWAIQFSRAGWEVNLATALIVWGVVLFLQAFSRQQKTWLWLLSSAVLLVLSMYTYHAARIIAPLLGLYLAGWWLKEKGLQQLKLLVPAAIVAILILTPFLLSLGSKTTNQRFAETSIFSDLSVIERSNALKDRAHNSLISRVFYHRYVLFSREMLINALSHFHPNFLFMTGDANPRHSIQFMGQLYHVEAILLLLGLVFVLFNWQPAFLLLFVWLIVGLLPASVTKATPHALRILPTLPVFMLLITFGINQLLETSLPKYLKKIIVSLLIVTYLVEFTLFWRFYMNVYPKLYATEWQYGYQQMVTALKSAQEHNPDLPVYVTREQGRPAMYYWFYTQTDPRLVQEQEATAKKDQGEFLEYNLQYHNDMKFVNSLSELPERVVLVASSIDERNKLSTPTETISEIDDLRGKPIWVIYIRYTSYD